VLDVRIGGDARFAGQEQLSLRIKTVKRRGALETLSAASRDAWNASTPVKALGVISRAAGVWSRGGSWSAVFGLNAEGAVYRDKLHVELSGALQTLFWTIWPSRRVSRHREPARLSGCRIARHVRRAEQARIERIGFVAHAASDEELVVRVPLAPLFGNSGPWAPIWIRSSSVQIGRKTARPSTSQY
jgi:hypothetical protein